MLIDIPDNLMQLASDGSSFVVTPDGEKSLLQLKKAQEDVEAAFDFMKALVKETAEKLDPNLVSVKGDFLTLSIQEVGAKYYLDQSLIDQVDPEIYEKKVTYSVKATDIDKQIKKLGGLPLGIKRSEDRNKTVKLLIKR